MVPGCGQRHEHGHPLGSQPRAEPALPPPPRGARTVASSHRQTAKVHFTGYAQKKHSSHGEIVGLGIVAFVIVVDVLVYVVVLIFRRV